MRQSPTLDMRQHGHFYNFSSGLCFVRSNIELGFYDIQ